MCIQWKITTESVNLFGQITSDDVICNILKVVERVAAIALSCSDHLPYGERLREPWLFSLEKAQGSQNQPQLSPVTAQGTMGPK